MADRRRAPWVFGCLVVLLAACSGGGAGEPLPAEVNVGQRLNDFHERSKRDGFRGVVDVRRFDERLLSEAYGPADAASGRANTLDTRFRIGGVTEQFTALAVLNFEAHGRLKTTDPVCRYLPACPPQWQPITVDDLLLHRSGLPDYLALAPDELAALDARRPSHQEFVAYLQGKPVERAPGTWRHSGTDYVVLGALIEAISATSYAQHLKGTVFQPLRMHSTTMVWDEDGPAGRAVGYVAGRAADAAPLVRYADRGLSSTSADLHLWNRFLLDGASGPIAVAGSEVRGRLTSAQVDTASAEVRQGYGAVFRNPAVRPEVHASGGVPGFTAYSAILPNTKVSVVVLANAEDPAIATVTGPRLLGIPTG